MCAVLLAIFNQLSGINVIMYYAPMIFEKAGASTNFAMLQAVAVGFTNLIFTIMAMFFIDKFGRKSLLLIGAVGMFFSLFGSAFHYYFEKLFGSTGVVVFIFGFMHFSLFLRAHLSGFFSQKYFLIKSGRKDRHSGSLRTGS